MNNISKTFNFIGAGLAAYFICGYALMGVDALTGSHLKEATHSFEQNYIHSQPEAEQNVLEQAIIRNPGSSLNLALFVSLVPAGGILWSRLNAKLNEGNDKNDDDDFEPPPPGQNGPDPFY